MQMGNTKSGSAAKVKTSYTYNPSETVLASCVASTFFSREPDDNPAPAAAAKPGQPAAK